MATNFEKKLIVLSGINIKGTATASISQSAYGVSVQVSANINTTDALDLVLVVRCGDDRQMIELGTKSKVCQKSPLKQDIKDWNNIHCILLNRIKSDYIVLMYGTNSEKVLWQGNMLDGLPEQVLQSSIAHSVSEIQNSKFKIQNEVKSELLHSAETAQEQSTQNLKVSIENNVRNAPYEHNVADAIRNQILPQSFDYSVSHSDEVQEYTSDQGHEYPYFATNQYGSDPFKDLVNTQYDDIAIASVNYYQEENKNLQVKSHQKQNDNNYVDVQHHLEIISPHEERAILDRRANVADIPQLKDIDFEKLPNRYKNTSPPIIDNNINNTYEKSIQNTKHAVTYSPIPNTHHAVTYSPIPNTHHAVTYSPIQNRDSIDFRNQNRNIVESIDFTNLPNKFRQNQNSNYTHRANHTIPNFSKNYNIQSNINPQNYGYNVGVFDTLDSKDIPTLYNDTSKVANQNILPTTFWDQVSEQVEKLFVDYPPEANLNKLLPDTKWVKVDYDNNGKYFVVGLIGKEKPRFVCYGVPDTFSSEPPREFDGYCQWMPLQDDPKGKGYWVMYQDATSGESVEF